jgi:dipeptidyl aminopeptidase/acylaminoacyl peptidase
VSHQSRQVDFYSGPGYKLSGTLFTPDPATRPADGFPGIVLCLGYRPVVGMFAPKYAQGFAELGYAVLFFEYRGFGASEGPRWRHIAQEQLEDVRNAITFLSSCEDVDASRIAVWGDASFGGAHAVMAGAEDDRVRCVAATTPFADGELLLKSTRSAWEWAEFSRRVAADREVRARTGAGEDVEAFEIIQFEASSHARTLKHGQKHPDLLALRYPLAPTTDAIMAYKPVEHVHKLAPKALLLVAAEHDHTTPAWHAQMLYDAARGPKRLVILRGAGHTDVHGRRLVDVMRIGAEWLARHLAPLTDDMITSQGDPSRAGEAEAPALAREMTRELIDRIEREAIS